MRTQLKNPSHEPLMYLSYKTQTWVVDRSLGAISRFRFGNGKYQCEHLLSASIEHHNFIPKISPKLKMIRILISSRTLTCKQVDPVKKMQLAIHRFSKRKQENSITPSMSTLAGDSNWRLCRY